MAARVLGLLLLLAASAGAAPLRYSPGEVLQALLDAQDARAWTRAEIIKSELDHGAKRKATRTLGQMTASGGKARLDIQSPAPGLIVADGKHLWVELPQVDQVYRYDQARLAASGNFFLDLASSIRHYAKTSLKRRFPLGPGYDEGRDLALELQPLRPDRAGFKHLRVWVDTRSWVVLRVQLDYGGTLSDIRFKHVHVMSLRVLRADPGQALPKDVFTYRRPKGFEVFKLDL